MNLHSTHTPKPVSLAPLSILGTRPAQQPKASAPRSATKPASAAPHIILVGRDDRDKAHASWFPEVSAEAARRAAERMNMHAVDIDASLQGVAEKLPAGKLFESGLAFVPFVKREIHDTLLARVSAEERNRVEAARVAASADKAAQRASDEADVDDIKLPPLTPAQLPPDWSKVKVGSVVLASDRQSDGWWEAVVEEEKKADGVLVLRWRQAPDMDQFLRRVDQVALLPTAYRGEA